MKRLSNGRGLALSLPAAASAYRPARAAELVRRHAHELTVGLAVVLVVVADVAWRAEETRPPHFDMAGHLTKSLTFYGYLTHFHPYQFLTGYEYYPPLVYWVADAFYPLFGEEMWVAVLSNVVFVTILAFSTYGLGRLLWSKRVGLLAAIFVLACPMLVSQFKEYQLDAPQTAMVALALYLLVRSKSFSSRGDSVVFGIACGLGLLTKWAFALAIAFPVGLAGIEAAVASVRARSRALAVNAGLAAVATYVVAGAWYVTNWGQLLPDFRSQGLNAQLHTAGGSQTLTHASSALWYLQRLMDPQLYVVFAALFVVGLAFCVWKPGALVRNRYPLALVVGTYVLFTILVVKDPRYTLSLLPGVAIVATSWTDALKPRLRSVAGVAIAACAVVTFLAISFGTQLLPKQVTVDVAGQEVALFAQRGYIIGPPTHEQWYQEAFVKRVAATKPGAELWYDGPGTLWFNHSGFYYFAARYGVRFSIVPDRADFIVRRRSSPPSAPSGFRPLESHRLPDGTWATLFQRNA